MTGKHIWRMIVNRVICAMFILAPSLPAQQPSPTPAVTSVEDTSRAAGVRDGRAEARKVSVRMRGFAAFGAGLPIGFFGPFGIYGGGGLAAGVAMAGGAGVVASMEAGSSQPPDSLSAIAAMRGIAYSTSFRQSYSDRVKSRRRAMALLAGVGGTATGLGALFALMSFTFFQ